MANAAVTEGKSGVVVFVGPCPFFVLFCCFGDETQVWLGDLRVVLLRCGAGFCELICLLLVQANCAFVPFFLTAYVSFRTVPQSIYGQSRGKKDVRVIQAHAQLCPVFVYCVRFETLSASFETCLELHKDVNCPLKAGVHATKKSTALLGRDDPKCHVAPPYCRSKV